MKVSKRRLEEMVREEIGALRNEGFLGDLAQGAVDTIADPIKDLLKEKINEYICNTIATRLPELISLKDFAPDIIDDYIPEDLERSFDDLISGAVCEYGSQIADYAIDTAVEKIPGLFSIFSRLGDVLFEQQLNEGHFRRSRRSALHEAKGTGLQKYLPSEYFSLTNDEKSKFAKEVGLNNILDVMKSFASEGDMTAVGETKKNLAAKLKKWRTMNLPSYPGGGRDKSRFTWALKTLGLEKPPASYSELDKAVVSARTRSKTRAGADDAIWQAEQEIHKHLDNE